MMLLSAGPLYPQILIASPVFSLNVLLAMVHPTLLRVRGRVPVQFSKRLLSMVAFVASVLIYRAPLIAGILTKVLLMILTDPPLMSSPEVVPVRFFIVLFANVQFDA